MLGVGTTIRDSPEERVEKLWQSIAGSRQRRSGKIRKLVSRSSSTAFSRCSCVSPAYFSWANRMFAVLQNEQVAWYQWGQNWEEN